MQPKSEASNKNRKILGFFQECNELICLLFSCEDGWQRINLKIYMTYSFVRRVNPRNMLT